MHIRTLTACSCILSATLGATSAAAQTVPEGGNRGPLADGRLVAFIAYAPPFTRTESRRVVVDGEIHRGDFAIRNGPGRGAGAAFEIRAFDIVRVGTAVTFVRRSEPGAVFLDETMEDAPASDIVMSRVSIALRFQEGTPALQRRRLYTGLHAGPAYVLEIPSSAANPGSQRSMGSWGFAAGFDVEATIAQGVAVQFGAEDYVMYWNEEELGRRVDEAFAAQGLDTATLVVAGASHAWLLRLGLTFIFR